jgi:hypothetical protein
MRDARATIKQLHEPNVKSTTRHEWHASLLLMSMTTATSHTCLIPTQKMSMDAKTCPPRATEEPGALKTKISRARTANSGVLVERVRSMDMYDIIQGVQKNVTVFF